MSGAHIYLREHHSKARPGKIYGALVPSWEHLHHREDHVGTKRLKPVDEAKAKTSARRKTMKIRDRPYVPKNGPIPPHLRSKGDKPQYDWVRIRQEYVEGIPNPKGKGDMDRWWPTYADLAARHGCAEVTVRTRASKERWKNLKDQQAVEYTKARQKKRAEKIANAAIQFDDNTLKVGEVGVALVMSRLSEIATEMRIRKDSRADAIERLARGEDVKPKDLRSAVYHQEMLSLANAAEKFQQIGLRALGTLEGNTTNTLNVNVDASTTNNVAQELIRDDKERATALVAAFAEIGALPAGFIEALDTVDRKEREEVVDAEIVENTEDLEPDAPTPSETVPDGEDEEEYELDPVMQAMIDNMEHTKKEI